MGKKPYHQRRVENGEVVAKQGLAKKLSKLSSGDENGTGLAMIIGREIG
jgi:hypothetical protein